MFILDRRRLRWRCDAPLIGVARLNWVSTFWLGSHTSSDYSDWTADAGINLQPSTPLSSRKRVRRRLSSSEEEEEEEDNEEEEEEEEEKQQSEEEEKPVKQKSKEKAKKAKAKSPRVSWPIFPLRSKGTFRIHLDAGFRLCLGKNKFTKYLNGSPVVLQSASKAQTVY